MAVEETRLDAVTIRIGIPRAQTARARRVLGLDQLTPARATRYRLDYRPVPPIVRSLAGVTLASQVDDAGRSRLTAQVRHVLRARLDPRWAGFHSRDGDTLTIEDELDLARRVLVATLVSTRTDRPQPSEPSELTLATVLTPIQQSFLQDCAPARILTHHPLDRSGPIRVLTWTIPLDQLEVTAGRWTRAAAGRSGPELDLIEISRRSLPVEAGFVLPVLAASLRRRGLDPDAGTAWLEARAEPGRGPWSDDRSRSFR